MAYKLVPIAIRMKEVQAAVGSHDEETIQRLADELRPKFAAMDKHDLSFLDPSRTEESVPRSETAVRQLICGGPHDDRVGFKYGFALEALCRRLGEKLPAEKWTAIDRVWLERIDQELASRGVPEETLRVRRHLLRRAPPFKMPRIERTPAIGYLTVAEIGAVDRALSAAKVEQCLDVGLRGALQELTGWLKTCVNARRDLICFCF